MCACSNLGLLPNVADLISLMKEDRLPASLEMCSKKLLIIAYAFLAVFVRGNTDNQAAVWALREQTICVWVGAGVGQEVLLGEVCECKGMGSRKR
jgi:hypothetical protein